MQAGDTVYHHAHGRGRVEAIASPIPTGLRPIDRRVTVRFPDCVRRCWTRDLSPTMPATAPRTASLHVVPTGPEAA
jgi:hypothetical protein